MPLTASTRSLSGMVDSNGVHFLRPQKIDTPYQLRPEVDSRVFLLKLFPGTQPDVLDFIAQAGYRGLVIEAFGLGGLHYIRRNLVEKLRMLRQRGVRILVLTQCMYEKADLSIYEVGTQAAADGCAVGDGLDDGSRGDKTHVGIGAGKYG